MSLKGLRYLNRRDARTPDAALPDEAMCDYARALAARLTVNGRAPLALTSPSPHALTRMGVKAERLSAQSESLPPAMEWLSGNIRWVEAVAHACRSGKRTALPARDGEPRLMMLMRELVAHSDALVTGERLTSALESFDGVQGLSMAELWLAPAALRIALLEAFEQVAEQVLRDQRARLQAEKWVQAGAPAQQLKKPGSAFCERALKLLHEQDTPEGRRALEEWLDGREGGSEVAIRRAHKRQAMNRLVIANVMASLRALEALNWEACFERISRADRRLREDAVYPKMDEASRARIRDEVTLISQRSGLSEWTVAHHAVRAAGEQEGGTPRATACYFLYDDTGRAELMARLGAASAHLPRITPDPNGRIILSLYAATALILSCLAVGFVRHPLLALPAILVALRFASEALGIVLTRLFKPRPILKLDLAAVPDDCRTLVAVPTLLSSAARAGQLVEQIETLGALYDDPNIEFLLLGDFRDHEAVSAPDDDEIAEAARSGIARLNERAGRTKYHYLNRGRVYAQRDKRFMGYERKRGALMALNELILGGDSAFDVEEASAPLIRNRFRYVVTLDADSRVLPGTIHKMIGAMAHPINRARRENGRRTGYALMSPRIELSVTGHFARLLGGLGGVDSYPTVVSSLYQDLCGRGIFGGKGIYDVRAFHAALSGVLPDGAILSHDLLEGVLTGVGFLGDLSVHDGFPTTLTGYLKRQNRWTRGDWQLTPFLFGNLPLNALDRFLMIDNLIHSLVKPAAVLLIALGLWTGNANALVVGLSEPFWPLLFSLPHVHIEALRRAVAKLSLMPVEAYTQLDAIARALYRITVSKRNLLEWTPAADAEAGAGGAAVIAGRALAILILPACLWPGWAPAAAGVALLFFCGVPWMRALEKEPVGQKLTPAQIASLSELAAHTWRFFEVFVPEDSPGLPPDNVQIDPPVGVARRTSPTNIGLYLVSCLAAAKLKLISAEQMHARMARTVDTLEALPKWRGHLYNWYAIDPPAPLPRRYVSAVDGGNLAACLMLAASAVGGALGDRMEALARGMDFAALYDKNSHLFYIGIDIERDKLSESHYDLLASESRILSYIAIALGQVPVRHWFRLGRPRTGRALISWSGTLFEYLMPELLLRAPEGSLLFESNRDVVRRQIKAHPGGWGVSESGFFAFDLQMNYQYRAFGLSELSLRGGAFEQVIAPYASMLALPVDAQAACENLENMLARRFSGEYGLYEAVDLDEARLVGGAQSQVVKSYMAHHQGMILAAVANALTDDALVTAFSKRPDVRALLLLLEEKAGAPARAPRKPNRFAEPPARRPAGRSTRAAQAGMPVPDGHLLYGGGATYFVDADGRGFLRVKGVMANRFREGLFDGEADGLLVHVTIGAKPVDLTKRVSFGEGEAQWAARENDVDCRLIQVVSPEDGSLYQHLTLKNNADQPRTVTVTGQTAVALCSQDDMRAHPAFQNLFVSSECPAPGVLKLRRRARDGRAFPVMVYAMNAPKGAALSHEADLIALLGRGGAPALADDSDQSLSGATGATLNPCAAVRARFTLGPGDKQAVTILTGLADTETAADALLARVSSDAADRARLLAGTQARAMLDFLSLDSRLHHALQRQSARLFYPQLTVRAQAGEKLQIGGLWALGISGNLPIIAVFVSAKEHLPLAREAARVHEFYRAMGVWCDLVFINDYGNDYLQPVRDQLSALIAGCHLRELIGQPGGVFPVDGQALSDMQRALIRKVAAIALHGGAGSMTAQMRRLPEPPPRAPIGSAMRRDYRHTQLRRDAFNGIGGFSSGGKGYTIDLASGKLPPSAWCNVLTNPDFGAIVSERGGGFTWHGNSRLSRLTPFSGDPQREGFSKTLTLNEPSTGRSASMIPVEPPARVLHKQGASEYHSSAEQIRFTVTEFVDAQWPVQCSLIELTNRCAQVRRLTLTATARFLMGAGAEDARMTECFDEGDILIARGAMPGAGYLAMPDAEAQDGALNLSFALTPGQSRTFVLLLGWADSADGCAAAVKRFISADPRARLDAALKRWDERLTRIELITPDLLVNQMVNRFLPYQAMAARIEGRAGLYQAGGAYGFRDQLQDMLCVLPIDPAWVRHHLLTCAAHQFESGDVMHWWHPPAVGVRTHISDDLVFLPYMTAQYVAVTGDRDILDEVVPYLLDVPIPEGREDIYAPMQWSDSTGTLHEHCLRAIERASRTGAHGLPLMGSGDWNDGMNRVGDEEAGESVWLAEFLSVASALYAAECAKEDERHALMALSEQMKQAVEAHGWDGHWYRRAYHRDGRPLGSDAPHAEHGCRIDMIAQGWAVEAGLDAARTEQAMDSAWQQLVDEPLKVIKLLTPPFDGEDIEPGYIAAYPPGIRENGGQYTHGACWGVMGWAGLHQGARAWDAFQMLLPYAHASTEAEVRRYRVEPYAVAADVYGEPPHAGRGGWTWYTGAAAWLTHIAHRHLMGYERRGDRVRLSALLPPCWPEASVKIAFGRATYTLTARRSATLITLDNEPRSEGWITLIDDHRPHTAIFPVRGDLTE